VGRSYFWDLEEHGWNSYPKKGRREEWVNDAMKENGEWHVEKYKKKETHDEKLKEDSNERKAREYMK